METKGGESTQGIVCVGAGNESSGAAAAADGGEGGWCARLGFLMLPWTLEHAC